MLIDSLIAKKVWVKSYVTGEIAALPKPMIMKGTIATAGDFPTTAEVLNGLVYKVTANVTDNNPAKTNTGLSFLAGDEICWIEELDTWVDLGSDALFVRDDATDTLSPANANDNLDLGSGDFITTGDVDAGTHSSLTLTPLATGFTVAGGTAPKTLTVSNDADVSGTNTGDQDLSGLVPYSGATGAVDLGTNTLSSGGLTTKGDSNLYSNSTDASVKDIKLFKSRGTFASPSAILTSDYLGEIVALGHDGSVTDYGHGAGYVRSASIRFKSTGNIGVNRVPSEIEFWTSTNAAPSVETIRGYIESTGNLIWRYQFINTGTLTEHRRTSIGSTSTDSFLASNTTASDVGTPVQMSPRIRERGSAWNTTSSASETVDCIQELLPVSGTSVSGTYRIGFSINGGAYSYRMTLTSAGMLGVNGITTGFEYIYMPEGYGIANPTITPGRFIVGGTTTGNSIDRNRNDAFAALTINNLNAGSTGNITNFQWQSVNQVTIGRTGTVSISSAQAIANVSTDGLVLENTSPALVGTPVQMSERTRYSGRAWETTGGTSQSVDCISELLPVSGATASGTYRIGFSINGGAYSYPFAFSSAGRFGATLVISEQGVFTSFCGVTYLMGSPQIPARGTFTPGTTAAGNIIERDLADALATQTINNKNASSTGNITNFQWQTVTRAFVDRFGVFASYGNDLPHTVKKAASANVRNSHDAEATSTSASYVKVKTITLTYGLVGVARFLFDLKTSDAGTPTPAYGRIYRNGVALGTEQSDVTGAYVTKSEDITQNWNPGDTVELWVKIAGGNTVSVQNFRIAYDDAPSITVASVNS